MKTLNKTIALLCLFTFLSVPQALSSPEPKASLESGTVGLLKDHFKSFSFSSKRNIVVSQNKHRKKRWDKVVYQKDEKDNYSLKKTASVKNGDVNYIWVDQIAHRLDNDRTFSYLESEKIFVPLERRLLGYWQDFWKGAHEDFLFESEGKTDFKKRPCTRYKITESKDKNASDSKKFSGYFLVDDKTGAILKSKVKLKYQKMPVSDAIAQLKTEFDDAEFDVDPLTIEITLQEEVSSIDKVLPHKLPKAK